MATHFVFVSSIEGPDNLIEAGVYSGFSFEEALGDYVLECKEQFDESSGNELYKLLYSQITRNCELFCYDSTQDDEPLLEKLGMRKLTVGWAYSK